MDVIRFNYAHLLVRLLLSNVAMRLEGWFDIDGMVTEDHPTIEQMRQHQADVSVKANDKDLHRCWKFEAS